MSDTKTEQPLIWNLPVSAGMASETGLRDENQDRMAGFSSPFGMVYLIADGMGGHKGGAEAARITEEGFQRFLLSLPPETPCSEALSYAASEIHRELTQLGASGDPAYRGLGSTVVIALIRPSENGLELIVAHMGDSRAYLHRAGQLTLLTRDHTQVQWLVDANEIDEETARSHPDSSVLTRALGHGDSAVIDVSEPFPLGDADGILLCSDGLSGFVASAGIDEIIRQFPDPSDCVRELIGRAFDRGSTDNVTVQFLRVGSRPAALLPASRTKRKTMPEGPVLASAPVYGSGQTPKDRRPLFAGLAVAAVLAGGAGWAFSGKLFPSRHAGTSAASVEIGKDTLLESLAKISADAERADREIKILETSLSGMHVGGAADTQAKRDLQALRRQIEEVRRDLRRISSGITRRPDDSRLTEMRDTLRKDGESVDRVTNRIDELKPGPKNRKP